MNHPPDNPDLAPSDFLFTNFLKIPFTVNEGQKRALYYHVLLIIFAR